MIKDTSLDLLPISFLYKLHCGQLHGQCKIFNVNFMTNVNRDYMVMLMGYVDGKVYVERLHMWAYVQVYVWIKGSTCWPSFLH